MTRTHTVSRGQASVGRQGAFFPYQSQVVDASSVEVRTASLASALLLLLQVSWELVAGAPVFGTTDR